jgi:hypothetical protein
MRLGKRLHWLAARWIWARGLPLRTLLLELLVAVSLAFLVWIYTRSREEMSLDQVEVPVKLVLAPGLAGKFELQISHSSRVLMSFSGPPSRMRELRSQMRHGQIQVVAQVAVPEDAPSENVYHDVVQIDPGNVPVPPGVTAVIGAGTNSVSYSLYRMTERLLPVQLDYSGEMRISDINIEPATVTVRGPKEVLDRARTIATQPYTMPVAPEIKKNGEALIQGQASLVRELEGRTIQTTPTNISFRFKAHPRKRTYAIKSVPIRFLCPPNFAWMPHFADGKPGNIAVQMRGPALEEPPTVLAFVDLTGADLGTGRNVLPLRIQLPPDFQLVNDVPRLIAFYLDPVERFERTRAHD